MKNLKNSKMENWSSIIMIHLMTSIVLAVETPKSSASKQGKFIIHFIPEWTSFNDWSFYWYVVEFSFYT